MEASRYIDELKTMPVPPQGMRALKEWAEEERTVLDVTPTRSGLSLEARTRRREKMRAWRDATIAAMLPNCCKQAVLVMAGTPTSEIEEEYGPIGKLRVYTIPDNNRVLQ